MNEDNLITEMQYDSKLEKSDHLVITWQTVTKMNSFKS